jgi:hypothetical protein
VDRDRLISALSAMTDDEFRQLTAEARPPTPTDRATSVASIGAKAAQLLNVERDHNGAVGGWAAAAAARGPAWQPPEPTQPQPHDNPIRIH